MAHKLTKEQHRQYMIGRYRQISSKKAQGSAASKLHALAQLQHLLGFTEKAVPTPEAVTVMPPLSAPDRAVEEMLARASNAITGGNHADKLPKGTS
jgi:hypothetical protein